MAKEAMKWEDVRKGREALKRLCLVGLAGCLVSIAVIHAFRWTRMSTTDPDFEPMGYKEGDVVAVLSMPYMGPSQKFALLSKEEAEVRRQWPVGHYVHNVHNPNPWCYPWIDENWAAGTWAETIPAPGYVEQDDKTIAMKIGDQVILPKWFIWTIGVDRRHEPPMREEELLRRWQARDGTVFKVVPRGEFPQ